jgi:putative colanic acid biosynthesis glycosyltransferase
MKVLQINSVCGIGSTGRIATDIHNILIEQGHESYIAYGRDLPKNCDDVIRIGSEIDNYTHVAKTRILDKHGFGSKRATIEFIKKVKELDPDIIHLHNIHGYYIHVEILFDYLKEANKTVVWTLHDCWSFTGHCSHFDYIGCDRWKTGCFDCPQKRQYPQSYLLDNSKWNYENKRNLFTGLSDMTIVTPSEWLAKKVKNSFLKEYKIEVIPNGIDLTFFRQIQSNFRKKNRLEDKFIILGVANNWISKKGFFDFLKLAESLRPDELIILVGVTKEQKKELPNNILGVTKTNSKSELAEIYSTSDIYINLTYEEVMGLTNVESMACGLPVITYDSGGSKECISNDTGWIAKKGDLQEIRRIISDIRDNDYSIYKNHCLLRAKDYYNKDRMVNDYLKLYHRQI